MSSPFRLVTTAVSPDTILALEELLESAKSGKLLGIAFVAMYHSREYSADATGEAKRNPTFTRGMLRALDDRLGDLARRQLP